MDLILTAPEIRVLGCLLEKETTTPEYYPLTLNSLVSACNQKSNRDPVVEFDEEIVLHALDDLREKQLAMRVDVAGSRVPKFRHSFERRFEVSGAQKALLCVLFLRGPQTVGELRGRAQRMHAFPDLASVEQCLGGLAEPDEESLLTEPLVRELPRRPGRKEPRYAHLFLRLSDDPEAIDDPSVASEPPGQPVSGHPQVDLHAAVEELRIEVDRLREEVADLRKEIGGDVETTC